VGSEAFEFPILAQEVLVSIELAIIISIAGFVGLIFIFTWSISLTIIGSCTMAAILIVALGLKLTLFSPVFDLLDVVCLVSTIGMLVDFPIHILLHFFDLTNNLRFDTSLESMMIPFGAFIQPREMSKQACKHGNPDLLTSLKLTIKCLSFALFFPLVLIIGSSVPLTKALFVLLSKTGEYILLLVVSSYLLSLTLYSMMLFLSYRISSCDKFSDQIISCYNGIYNTIHRSYISCKEGQRNERVHTTVQDFNDTTSVEIQTEMRNSEVQIRLTRDSIEDGGFAETYEDNKYDD
jgi:hypothetical protein